MRVIKVKKPRMRKLNEIPLFFYCPICSNPFQVDSAYIQSGEFYLKGIDGQGRRVCQNCLYNYLKDKKKEVREQ